MALDKLVDSTKLDAALEATADAIREKTGDTDDIAFDLATETGFADAVEAIPSGGGDPWEWFDKAMNSTINGTFVNRNANKITNGLFARDSTIRGCVYLGNVVFGVGSVAADRVFFGCNNIEYIIFVNSKKSATISHSYVGVDFASYCSKLKIASFNEIGAYFEARALGICELLRTIVISADTVQRLPFTSVFQGSTLVNNGTARFYVPDSLVNDYKAASVWVTYASQIYGFSDAPAYGSGATYSVGDVVKNAGKFYAWINLTAGNSEPIGAKDSVTGDWVCIAEI